MNYKFVALAGALLAGRLLAAGASAPPAADLIVTHAKIWTQNAKQPEAEALAVLGDRIVAIGNLSDVIKWQGSKTRIEDAQGKRVIPGFNDAHVHFSDGSASLTAVQLNDATSLAEFVKRIQTYAAHQAAGEWIREGEWDETKWQPANLPTREDLDKVTPNNPVALDRYDGHMVLANSQALKLAGITAKTPDPPGGEIVRDAKGDPTGALKDAAEELLYKAIPPKTHAQRRRAIENGLKEAARLGVTSVQDMSEDYGDLAVFAELVRENKLSVRVYGAPLIANVEDQAKLGIGHAFGSSMLRIGALKQFADGSLGSRTAYFFQPFSDAPATGRGLLAADLLPLEKSRERLKRADATGLQVCTHAIGDAAISQVLDLYAEIEKADGPRDRRWRVEHAQHMAAADFDRFAKLHVIASMQPYQAIDDGRWAEGRIGHDRASRTYAFKTFLDHGVHLAFGTDWPVAPLNPLWSVYGAVTRATLDGKNPNGWFPEQKISVKDALYAYTMGSAYAEFQEEIKGSLEVGKLADFVVLSDDILSIDPKKIRDVRVLGTFMGGRKVFTSAP